MRILISLVGFLLFSASMSGQNMTDLSFEVQVYPTGLIPGIRWSKKTNDTDRLLLRLGYNWFRHRDLGVHDDERGGGVGGSIGYLRYLNTEHKSVYIGLKNDIWFNKVDWFDEISSTNVLTGKTSILVLQPTLELGYTLLLQNSHFLTPTISFGYEWNVKTNGEPTGQGAILLIGIQIGKRF